MNQIQQANLKIFLRGRKRLSEQECSKNSNKNYDYASTKIIAGYKNNKPIFETITVPMRKHQLVFKHMTFRREQISYMLETPLYGEKFWKTLPDKVKIQKHCEQIVHDCCGVGYELEFKES